MQVGKQETVYLVDKMKIGQTGVDSLLDEFKNVFTTELGTISNVQDQLLLEKKVTGAVSINT